MLRRVVGGAPVQANKTALAAISVGVSAIPDDSSAQPSDTLSGAACLRPSGDNPGAAA